jgi:hypothetical protein
MIYFALNHDGLAYNLGDHGDWESADDTAINMKLEPSYLFDENEARSFAEFILQEIEQTKKAIEKVSR